MKTFAENRIKNEKGGDQNDYSGAFKTVNATYSGAGWYAVPEPTSGLLLLIGVAGLALKRKRA